MKVLLSVCLFFAPILAAPYAGTFLGDDTPSISGHQINKREITNFDDLIFEDINADAVRNKRESEDSESNEKSSEESSETESEAPELIDDSEMIPKKPEAISKDWWQVESGLTPNKLDTLIDVVNKINDVFASFIERYDKFHGTTPKETTEEPEIMTPEPGMGGDDKTEAPEISKESKESMESKESSETKEDTEDSDDAEEGMTEDGDDEAEDKDEEEEDKDEDEEVDEEKDEDDEEEDDDEDDDDEAVDDEENEDDEAEDKDEEEEDKDEDEEVDEEKDEDEEDDEEEEDDDEDDE